MGSICTSSLRKARRHSREAVYTSTATGTASAAAADCGKTFAIAKQEKYAAIQQNKAAMTGLVKIEWIGRRIFVSRQRNQQAAAVINA